MVSLLAIFPIPSKTTGDKNCPKNVKLDVIATALSACWWPTQSSALRTITGNKDPCPKPIKQTLNITSGTLFVNVKKRNAIPIPKSITGIMNLLKINSILTSSKLVIIPPTVVNETTVPARVAAPKLFCSKYKAMFVAIEYYANIMPPMASAYPYTASGNLALCFCCGAFWTARKS